MMMIRATMIVMMMPDRPVEGLAGSHDKYMPISWRSRSWTINVLLPKTVRNRQGDPANVAENNVRFIKVGQEARHPAVLFRTKELSKGAVAGDQLLHSQVEASEVHCWGVELHGEGSMGGLGQVGEKRDWHRASLTCIETPALDQKCRDAREQCSQPL